MNDHTILQSEAADILDHLVACWDRMYFLSSFENICISSLIPRSCAGLLRAVAEAGSREVDHVCALSDALLSRLREIMATSKAPKPLPLPKTLPKAPPKPPPPLPRPAPPPPGDLILQKKFHMKSQMCLPSGTKKE